MRAQLLSILKTGAQMITGYCSIIHEMPISTLGVTIVKFMHECFLDISLNLPLRDCLSQSFIVHP